MIIDVHTHVFPDALGERAVVGISHFYGLSMQEHDGKVSTLLRLAREAGVDRMVICAAATNAHQTTHVNDFLAQTLREHPGIFYGFGTVHHDWPDKAGEVDRMLGLGLRGLKMHPDIQGCPMDDPRLDALYEAMEGRMILLAHTGDVRYHNSNPPQLKRVLEKHPRLTVIAAHLGFWSNWEQGVGELAGYGNLYVDCSSSLYAISREKAVEIIRGYGMERVLFGSDFPMWEPKAELERLEALNLTPDEMDHILYKNALALLGDP